MAVTTSYEVCQKRQNDWAILFVLHDREEALDQAREYIQRKPSSIVRVIEERLDTETHETKSTIIFHGGLAKPKQETDDVFAQWRRRRRPTAPKKEHTLGAFLRSAIIVVFSACGIVTAALIGLAMVVDLIR
ncbi:MAG: hypothetical protein H6905_07255 [Hyphomicrobiales bacterium]|nr:hypothetical protein [Hyphomicrobiales bacterium]